MQVWLWWIIFTDCCWVHGLQDNLFRESQNIPCMCRAFEIHYFYQQKSPAAANAYWLYTVLTAAQCRHELEFSKYDTCTTPTHLRSCFFETSQPLRIIIRTEPTHPLFCTNQNPHEIWQNRGFCAANHLKSFSQSASNNILCEKPKEWPPCLAHKPKHNNRVKDW